MMVTGAATATANITGLVSNTAYEVQVAAIGAPNGVDDPGAFSTAVEGTTSAAPGAPAAPTIVSVTPTGGTADTLTVAWTLPATTTPPIRGYVVQYEYDDNGAVIENSFTGVFDDPGTASRTTDILGLMPATAYRVRVAVHNSVYDDNGVVTGGGRGPFSSVASGTTASTGHVAPQSIVLTVDPDEVSEGTSRYITVTATTVPQGSTFAAAQTVTVTVVDDTAEAGSDYTAIPSGDILAISIEANTTSGVTGFLLQTIDDTTIDKVMVAPGYGVNETIMVTGVHTTGRALTVTPATLTLIDDEPDGIVLTLDPASVQEGDTRTITVTATITPAGAVFATPQTVAVTVADASAEAGTDYTAVTGVSAIVIAPDATSGTTTFSLATTSSPANEPDKTITVNGVHTGASPAFTIAGATLTLSEETQPVPPAPEGIVLTADPASVSEGSAQIITVTAAATPAGAVFSTTQTITLVVGSRAATEGEDFVAVTNIPALTIAGGEPSGETTFTLTILDDEIFEKNERVKVRGTHRSASALNVASVNITITDDDNALPNTPGAPGEVTVSATTDTDDSLTVTWSPPASAGATPIEAYLVQHRRLLSGGRTEDFRIGAYVPDPALTSADVPGLIAGASYEVRVVAINSIGEGDYSALVIGVVNTSRTPDAPTSVVVMPTAGTDDSLTVTWSPPASPGTSPVNGYIVQYRRPTEIVTVQLQFSTRDVLTTYDFISVAHTGLATTATIPGLAPDTTYEVRVAATNRHGLGAPIHFSATTAQPGAPDAPTSVVAAPDGSDALTVTWYPPANEGTAAISGYIVQYRRPGDGAGVFSSITHGSTAASVGIDALIPNTAYEVRVAAVNSRGPSVYSALVHGMTAAVSGAPGAPGMVRAAPTPGVSGSLTVIWDAPANAGAAAISGYIVQHRSPGASVFTATGVTVEDFPALTATIDDLAPGVAYEVRVAAVNDAQGAFSTSVFATTGVAPGVPGEISATPASNTSNLTVTWTAPSEMGGSAISAYTVQYRVLDASALDPSALVDVSVFTATGVTVDALPALSATITGLDFGTIYLVRVAASNDRGHGLVLGADPRPDGGGVGCAAGCADRAARGDGAGARHGGDRGRDQQPGRVLGRPAGRYHRLHCAVRNTEPGPRRVHPRQCHRGFCCAYRGHRQPAARHYLLCTGGGDLLRGSGRLLDSDRQHRGS